MKSCSPSPCRSAASCPMRQTMAASWDKPTICVWIPRNGSYALPFAFLMPPVGRWTRKWAAPELVLTLPDVVVDLSGKRLAPPLFLDTGGFDRRQAHTRRHIDRLKKKVTRLEARRDQFPVGDQRREPSERKLVIGRREIARCWRKYEARNKELAHMAANLLLLLATVWEAELRAGECRRARGGGGRGRGAKGRWLGLAQQLPDPGDALAVPALQMPPGWGRAGLAACQGNHPHLPQVWQARPDLCGPGS